jgi:hypothetical protein
MSVEQQQDICRQYGVEWIPPVPGSKVGIALQTLGQLPLHGVRVEPTESTCGWYLHGGEWSDADDYYQPLCVEHVEKYCPAAISFLGLPPGWNFLTDGRGFVDVWQTESISSKD